MYLHLLFYIFFLRTLSLGGFRDTFVCVFCLFV